MKAKVFLESLKKITDRLNGEMVDLVSIARDLRSVHELPEKQPVEDISGDPQIERALDEICLIGAWAQDRLNGLRPGDKGTITRKIKKALGYNVR